MTENVKEKSGPLVSVLDSVNPNRLRSLLWNFPIHLQTELSIQQDTKKNSEQGMP